MPIQIGRKKQVPIYGTTTTTGPILSTNTLSNYFKITQGSSYGWSNKILSGTNIGMIESTPGNVGVNSSTATVTFEAVRDLSGVRIDYIYYTESNYDKITVTIDNEILLNAVSGVAGPSNPTTGSISYKNLIYSRDISAGTKITFKYVKDSSNSHTYESYTEFIIQCPPYTTTTTEITGYEEKLLPQTISNLYLSPTKKIVGGWIKGSSGAKQFYGDLVFKYTGNYTTSDITISGVNYNLYTLTTSGTLTLNKDSQVWACGGGAGGGTGTSSGSGGGGGGGYVLEATTLSKGKYTVIIGAGGASNKNGSITSIGNLSANGGNTMPTTIADGGSGGSGGGAGGRSTPSSYIRGAKGAGAGISTYPFGLTDFKAHSAGGGGGGDYYTYTEDGTTYVRPLSGGKGGTNGSSGETGVLDKNAPFGAGGDYGGGDGGDSSLAGNSATFYGGGGGGGGRRKSSGKDGGSGYQGVTYILIKK